jgi:hypothetical protein
MRRDEVFDGELRVSLLFGFKEGAGCFREVGRAGDFFRCLLFCLFRW